MFTPLSRIFKNALKNFRRQTALQIATIFILAISISILTSLFLFRSTINYLVSEIQKKIDVSVYFQQNAPQEEIEKIKEGIVALEDIEEVEYISSEEALVKFKERHKNDPLIIESLEFLGQNPFYPSLNIKAKNPNQYASILAYLDGDNFQNVIYKVDYIKKKNLIDRIFSFTSNISLMAIFLSVFLGAIAVLMAFNTIRVAIKDSSEEITIMKLVGASNWFIQGPFILQGVICGLIAALTVFVFFTAIVYFATPKIMSLTGGFNSFAWFSQNIFNIFLIQFGGGLILSFVSSIIATRRYL